MTDLNMLDYLGLTDAQAATLDEHLSVSALLECLELFDPAVAIGATNAVAEVLRSALAIALENEFDLGYSDNDAARELVLHLDSSVTGL